MNYRFDEVLHTLAKHWGMVLQRCSTEARNNGHDSRWDVTCSTTGFVVSGQFPGHGYGHRHYTTLKAVVRIFDLARSCMTDTDMLTALKRYRAAYYAEHTYEMRITRDYERQRGHRDFDHEAWEQYIETTWEERSRLRQETSDALLALVDEPPADYVELVTEMRAEFGE